jgi:hypothetical protein
MMQSGQRIVLIEDDQLCLLCLCQHQQIREGGKDLRRFEFIRGREEIYCQA